MRAATFPYVQQPRIERTAALALALAWLVSAAAGARADAPGHAYQDPRFRIEVSVPEAARSLRAEITPRAPWKLSADFPIRFSVEGGPTARSPVPGSPDGATLEVPLAELPSGRVSGRISVAVCQGELCERADHDFQIAIP